MPDLDTIAVERSRVATERRHSKPSSIAFLMSVGVRQIPDPANQVVAKFAPSALAARSACNGCSAQKKLIELRCSLFKSPFVMWLGATTWHCTYKYIDVASHRRYSLLVATSYAI